MQMSIIEVFICRRLHMNTSMILICIWLICRLCTALHTKCCGAVRVDAVYIDFAKAFDSVSHSKLLLKATLYGFTSHLLDWLSSFLSDRFQCVYIHESQSTLLPVISSVPQGSVLGPLLFLIYINDLPDCLTPPVKVKIYADDTKLYSARYSTEDPAFSNSLSEFCNWSSKWQLTLLFKNVMSSRLEI